MEIIPAIDIIGGKCVRLTHGDYNQVKVYNEAPLEVAKSFEAAGLRRVHLVDLDGAKAGAVKNWKVLESLASKTGLSIDFGGGIKTAADVDIVFNSGALWATIGSIAVSDSETFESWLKTYGTEKFFLGADVKNEKIAINGWQNQTEVWVYDFIEGYLAKGLSYVFCTDIEKDGALQGASVNLYQSILEKLPNLELVASGGVASIHDLEKLQRCGCNGAIVGKAIYEGRITLKELETFQLSNQ